MSVLMQFFNLPNVLGTTPLMTAAGMGHGNNPSRGKFNTDEDGLKAAEILLRAGANIHAQAADGQTAVHSAAQKGWNKVLKFLVGNGASINAKDLAGRTPLDYAKGNIGANQQPPHPDTAALLEKLGAQ